MDTNSIHEAIEILINNFTRHPRLSHLTHDSKLNVYDVLQEFWHMKHIGSLQVENPTLSQENLIFYDFLERPGQPYVCLCTIPSGACFATFQNTNTKSEAKKSAALLALMNSLFNEHPLRRINEDFIKKSLESAHKDFVLKINHYLLN